MPTQRFVMAVAGLLAAAGAAVWAFRADPVPVDLVTAQIRPMQVTVSAEGVTRVREPYLVTAPLAGTTARSPVAVGDTVRRGETVVASIRPAAPALLDARARRQAEAAVIEAEAALRLARADLVQAETNLTHVNVELTRNRALADRGVISERMLDEAEMAQTEAETAVATARSDVDLKTASVLRAKALLLGPEVTATGPDACCVDIPAPQSGTVLSVANTSARLVQAGEPLLSIGDLSDLEIEVEFLSVDAVRIATGARALVERWGGDGTLQATVRRIEPSAFTKVSALGIEEQRVRLKLDFVTPATQRAGLGDNYRVFVRVVVWADDAVLQVPVSALFRSDGGWALFREVDGRAVLTPVDIGRKTPLDAQVTGGLAEGDRVVAFPGNKVEPDVRLTARIAE